MRFFAKFTRYEIGRIWVKEWVVVDDWAMEWTSTFFPPPLPPLSKHFWPPAIAHIRSSLPFPFDKRELALDDSSKSLFEGGWQEHGEIGQLTK
jgi:hypothetical protein